MRYASCTHGIRPGRPGNATRGRPRSLKAKANGESGILTVGRETIATGSAPIACMLILGDFYTVTDTRLVARPHLGRPKTFAGLGGVPQPRRMVHRV